MASGRSSPNQQAVESSELAASKNSLVVSTSYSKSLLPIIQGHSLPPSSSEAQLLIARSATPSADILPIAPPALERSQSAGLNIDIEPAVPAYETQLFSQVRSKIIDDMVDQKKIDKQHAEALQRAIDHVVAETAEVISWLPHIEYSSEAYQNGTFVIHYDQPLYETMYKGIAEAKTNKYLVENAVHLRDKEPDKIYKPRKHLDNINRPLNLVGANVVITICYGIEKHLSGKALNDLVQAYLGKGANSVQVYLGEYNSVEHPLDQIADIEKAKKQSWFSKNQWLVKLSKKDNRVSILQRATLVGRAEYKHAQSFIEKHLLNDPTIYQAIINDAMRYTDSKLKKWSPTPGLTKSQKEEVAREFSPSSLPLIIKQVVEHVKVAKNNQEIDNMVHFMHGMMLVSDGQAQARSPSRLFSHSQDSSSLPAMSLSNSNGLKK